MGPFQFQQKKRGRENKGLPDIAPNPSPETKVLDDFWGHLHHSNLSGDDTFSIEAPQIFQEQKNILRTFPLVRNYPLKVAANFLEHSFEPFWKKCRHTCLPDIKAISARQPIMVGKRPTKGGERLINDHCAGWYFSRLLHGLFSGTHAMVESGPCKTAY